jgi:hypothetical protein
MDKLVNSLIKTLNTMCNDSLTKDIINLYTYERSRKWIMNESLYLCNFIQLIDSCNINCFRLYYSAETRVMSIHLIDMPDESNRKDYIDSFKEYIDHKLQEGYAKLIEENQGDDGFTLFLDRNVRLMRKRRKHIRPLIFENELLYKVFDNFKSSLTLLLKNYTLRHLVVTVLFMKK